MFALRNPVSTGALSVPWSAMSSPISPPPLIKAPKTLTPSLLIILPSACGSSFRSAGLLGIFAPDHLQYLVACHVRMVVDLDRLQQDRALDLRRPVGVRLLVGALVELKRELVSGVPIREGLWRPDKKRPVVILRGPV